MHSLNMVIDCLCAKYKKLNTHALIIAKIAYVHTKYSNCLPKHNIQKLNDFIRSKYSNCLPKHNLQKLNDFIRYKYKN